MVQDHSTLQSFDHETYQYIIEHIFSIWKSQKSRAESLGIERPQKLSMPQAVWEFHPDHKKEFGLIINGPYLLFYINTKA